MSSVIQREYADGYYKPIPVYPASPLGSFKSDLANAPRSFVDDRYGFRDERACSDILWDLRLGVPLGSSDALELFRLDQRNFVSYQF